MNEIYTEFIVESGLDAMRSRRLGRKRGLRYATSEELKFGFGLKERTEKFIEEWRSTGKFSDDELQAVGILVEGYGGELTVAPQLNRRDIIIPYLDEDGEIFHLRPHKCGLKGQGIELYCPYLLKDNSGFAILTEGEFKAAAAWQMDWPALAVPGISSFGGVHFQRLVELLGKHGITEVTIIFDNEVKNDPELPSYKSDPMKRWDTEYWAIRMARQLIEAGIEAYVGRLPDEWRIDGKIDIDGALAAGHGEDEFQEIIDGALHPDEYLMTLCDEAQEVILAKFAKAKEPPRNFDNRKDAEVWIHHLNQRHAVVPSSGKTMVMNLDYDPIFKRRLITYSTNKDFRDRYLNQQICIAEKPYQVADYWLKHPRRKEYKDGVVFLPGQGQLLGCYNLYKGFAVEPEEGDCDLFLKHLREVICAGDEGVASWALSWLADCVQNPAERPGTALVLQGRQGTGKGMFMQYFGTLFGRHYLHITSSRHLTGHFNAHLEDALLVFADEAHFAGDRASLGALKGLVTEDLLMIERKYHDPRQVKNFVRVIMASNNPWVIAAAGEERRFCVLEVSEAHMQDKEYFAALSEEMESGGREALLHYLLEYDINEDLRTIPKTDALQEQQVASLDSADSFWLMVLDRGALLEDHDFWKQIVAKRLLHAEFQKFARNRGDRHPLTPIAFGMRLGKLCPSCKGDGKTTTLINGDQPHRENAYRFPPLEQCRKEFEAEVKMTPDWPPEEDPSQQLFDGDERAGNSWNKVTDIRIKARNKK
ncbi:MAG: DUF5906 domain-containing protein [Desulfarculaceae bacterium]|nr:DUF5906 domain-containing protein [Desulfarculaceae bacterium]MCF8118324.1 DUF5906 domain-containing protein [Desulfarculaceae bacterium]